jgi:hypothetical protein
MSKKTNARLTGTLKLMGIVVSLTIVASCCVVGTALILILGLQSLPQMSTQPSTPMELTLTTATPLPTAQSSSTTTPKPTELDLSTMIPTPTELNAVTTTPPTNENLFIVSGTISSREETQIPADTRVLVLWSVMTTDPDSGYIFGEGEIDVENNTFQVVFDRDPPVDALNQINGNGFGVAVIMLTTDQSVNEGVVQNSDIEKFDNVFAMSDQYALMYIVGDLSDLFDETHWIYRFPQSYSVGKGIEVSSSSSGDFRPTELRPINPTDIEIIIGEYLGMNLF